MVHESLNPLGIGEGFERPIVFLVDEAEGLNPLEIGEGFELKTSATLSSYLMGLNPLGIGEGFEHMVSHHQHVCLVVLIP